MYAVIDIETTGGSPEREKITEIALCLTDGMQVVNERSTLVNPEKRISSRITQLTGITNDMVEGPPRFYEIAKELIALLLESTEIKKHMPVYNRTQRRNSTWYGISQYYDEHGYLWFSPERNTDGEIPLLSFTSKDAAFKKRYALLEKYHLCRIFCGLYKSNGPCFQYQIGICSGACAGKESPEEYNRCASTALREFELDQDFFFILDRGREPGELAVVKIEHGHLVGYGYIQEDDQGFGMDSLHDCIRLLSCNREMRPIVKTWLRKNKRAKVVSF